MPSSGLHGYGSKIYVAAIGTAAPVTDPPGDPWEVLAEVKKINGLAVEPSDTELTHLNSDGKAKEYMAGMFDSGQVTFTVNYYKANMTDITTLFPAQAAGGRTVSNLKFLVRFPDSGLWYFEGFLKGIPFDIPEDGPITMDVTIKVSGLPTFIALA